MNRAPIDKHPAVEQAEADIALPLWWPAFLLAVLVLTIALSAAYANGVTS